MSRGLSDRSMEGSPLVLDVQGLVKRYGSRTVVNGVNFQIREGEVVGLLGLNGAGKTTSFRMTCGLISANEGRVILGGKDVSDWPMSRRAREGRMGYLPQERSVFGTLTTEQNMYIMAELLGMKRSMQRQRCKELMRDFQLEGLRNTVVGTGGTGGLSGGERRRLEFARALLSEPKVLLLDEPFANVDPPTVAEIQSVIVSLVKKGISCLITDHQFREVLEIANRIYVIDKGEVLCSGTAEEVLANEEAQRRYFYEKTKALNHNEGAVDFPVAKNKRTAIPARSEMSSQGYVVPESASESDRRSNEETQEASRRSLRLQRREQNGSESGKASSPEDDILNTISTTFRKKN